MNLPEVSCVLFWTYKAYCFYVEGNIYEGQLIIHHDKMPLVVLLICLFINKHGTPTTLLGDKLDLFDDNDRGILANISLLVIFIS